MDGVAPVARTSSDARSAVGTPEAGCPGMARRGGPDLCGRRPDDHSTTRHSPSASSRTTRTRGIGDQISTFCSLAWSASARSRSYRRSANTIGGGEAGSVDDLPCDDDGEAREKRGEGPEGKEGEVDSDEEEVPWPTPGTVPP